MMKIFSLIFPLLFAVLCVSCEQVKKEGEELVEKAKSKASKELEEQTQRVIDKVYPPFDHDKPDTENNKQRFRDFIRVEITPDVKNIYCFDDAIGIDADYMFAFNCSKATSEKIIKTHQLSVDTINPDNGSGLQHDFPWWNKDRLKSLQKLSWADTSSRYFKYYWYDASEKKAYYFEFDM